MIYSLFVFFGVDYIKCSIFSTSLMAVLIGRVTVVFYMELKIFFDCSVVLFQCSLQPKIAVRLTGLEPCF